jgi:hypothetical protein
MRFVTLVLFGSLIGPSLGFAKPTCRNYEEPAAEYLKSLISEHVLAIFAAKGIVVDPSKLQVYVSTNTINDNGTTYFSPFIWGDVTSASGTEFDIFPPVGSENLSGGLPIYVMTLKSKGFDKEGNPIDAHCFLHFVSPYSNSTRRISVQNANSNVSLDEFRIPMSFQAY